MRVIRYKAGYKYQLAEEYECDVGLVFGGKDIDIGFISLDVLGRITIAEGYAWDGPSGVTIDTPNFMRPSLVHDALYQLMRLGRLDASKCREPADALLRTQCRKDGMGPIRAWYVYKAVRWFGAKAASRDNVNPVLTAPKTRKKR